jgi:hypothetical protein
MDFFDRAPGAGRWLKNAALFLLLAALPVRAADGFSLDSLGGRYGFGANRSSQRFWRTEGFLSVNLPWRWDMGKDFSLRPRWEVAGGWLSEGRLDGGLGATGPALALTRQGWPLGLEGGSSATFLTRSDYVTKDLGGPVQFTSYAGVYWNFGSHWRLGYRFEHMSNASLYSSNPGVNLHVLSLSLRF